MTFPRAGTTRPRRVTGNTPAHGRHQKDRTSARPSEDGGTAVNGEQWMGELS